MKIYKYQKRRRREFLKWAIVIPLLTGHGIFLFNDPLYLQFFTERWWAGFIFGAFAYSFGSWVSNLFYRE